VNEQQVTAEQARAALEADKRQRAAACKAEVEATLQKYRCTLDCVITVEDGRLIGHPGIVALE
jgi:hypothetical protein